VRQVVAPGWFFLAAMILAYGVANLLQSMAAARTSVHHTFDPGLLVRLAGQRTYLLGIACQTLGFVLAFLARRDLPLFLVQASVAAGLGVTAVLGVLLLKWSLPAAEVVLLGLLLAGITALVLAAQPAHSRRIGPVVVLLLAVSVLVMAVLGFFAARLHGALGSVVLGSLAGVDFSAAAIAARPLTNEHSVAGFLTNPLLYLVVIHSLVGQLLLGLAMHRARGVHRGHRRRGRRGRGAGRDRRPAAARRPDRARPRLARGGRLRRDAARGDRADPLRRAATPSRHGAAPPSRSQDRLSGRADPSMNLSADEPLRR